MRLNGWQRLFVVFSIVYVLIVTSIAVGFFPFEKPGKPTVIHMRGGPVLHFPVFIGEDLAFRILERETELRPAWMSGTPIQDAGNQRSPSFRFTSYPRPTNPAALESVKEALREGQLPATGQTLPALLEDLLAAENEVFAKEQWNYVWLSILIALAPLIAVYFAGVATAWIIRGFKSKSNG